MELSQPQEEFLDLLGKSLGVVSVALQKCGIERTQYEAWLKNTEFKKRIDRINEMSIDFVENKLLLKIQDGDLSAIQFYLKTKGKKRGY